MPTQSGQARSQKEDTIHFHELARIYRICFGQARLAQRTLLQKGFVIQNFFYILYHRDAEGFLPE